MTRELVEHLLKAPESQLDPAMTEKIRTWSDPPSALQILEVLDHCIHGALASGVVVTLLELEFSMACAREGVAPDVVARQATWRGEP